MSRFLRFTVSRALAGEGVTVKEALVGVEVFDRAPGYDPRIDPIVRVEARRLRQKLARYYQQTGAGDPLVIEYPKGSYAPVFRLRKQDAPTSPAAAAPASDGAARPDAPSILVLPFANLDPSGQPDYFSDGLTQELIHALTKVPGLRVVAWSTAARIRDAGGSATDPRVQASTILEGAVRRLGDRVRITVQLVEAKSGVYLWTETYERTLSDLFAIQEEIAVSIASLLRVRLAPPQPAQRPYSVEAYDFYLKGRYEWFRRTPEALRQSIALFERAIRADAQCAPAWTGLADARSLLADYGIESAREVMPMAREAASRALEIDPSLAEAHVSIAYILGVYDWEWEQAETHYQKALALNPGYVTAHHWYGLDHLASFGRFDEAVHHLDIAYRLDPLEPILAEGRAYLSILRRDFDEAVRRYTQLAQDAPHFSKGWTGLGRAYWGQRRFDKAIEAMEKGREIAGEMPSILGALAQIYGCAGNVPKSRRVLAQMHALARRRHVSAVCFAIAHLGLREPEQSLEWLEKACADHELALVGLKVNPIYDDLRSFPRFQTLLEKVGLKG